MSHWARPPCALLPGIPQIGPEWFTQVGIEGDQRTGLAGTGNSSLRRLPAGGVRQRQRAEGISALLADEGAPLVQLAQHRQHIAGRAAGIDLQQTVADGACATLGIAPLNLSE